MRFFDPKFKNHRRYYYIQSAMAMLIIFIMSSFIDIFIQTATIASMGATVFILFTMPHKRVSCSRYIFGGYTIGITMGLIAHVLSTFHYIYAKNVTMALAVGLAIFFMVVTNTEHPPAAALALGIAIEGADFMTVVSIYISISIVYLGKKLMGRWLRDLM